MSNIGGAATMVGDPPALIIGEALWGQANFGCSVQAAA